ncbi:DHHA2 domain protein [Gregarina niphandrodes]|uniref:DHHA2 domain protein n=1 Tax=Gregarina niphandrodes TaxID=110365 RepID=A0A023BB28_GRENI|nr:DHHA2 domain protein [Gregarina niphandrodes]EZG78678.1 DHHA2 domain protein [Gregarina niphandrodes]|eukprot:XP_011129209.1 DHHA2 domain protein [Gregarina niphandrodes]
MGLDLNEFETSDQANKKEWACLILVDHNYYHEHEGPDRDDVPPIIGIIDHHEDSEQIMGNCPKIIEVPRASTCSLVGELYLQTTTGTNINQNISCLLASIIEHDAYHFDEGVKGIRWVDMDKKIYHDLMEQAAISSGRPSEEIVCAHRNAIKSQFKEYSESLVNLNISDALLNDNKIFHYNTYDLIFASMPVHLGALIDDKDDNCVSDEFAKYVTACAGKNKTTTDLFICLSRGSECRELAIAYMDSAEKLAAKIRDHLLGWGDNVCLKQEARPRKFGPWAIITLQLDRNKSRKIVEPHLRALFKD